VIGFCGELDSFVLWDSSPALDNSCIVICIGQVAAPLFKISDQP